MQEFKGLPIRGIHFDLKAHMMNFSMLCDTARKMARLGYNTILLEYQDKFPFTGSLSKISAPDALTKEEILSFDRLCTSLGMRIIPLIQCLGHMYYVLCHREYAHLAESGGIYTSPHALCPSNPGSVPFFAEMADQVLALHPSCRYVHIGGDEARLSDTCPACGKTPKYELLCRHYEACCEAILDRGKRPIMWSDMLLAHPETLDVLRGKVTVMDWDYQTTGAPGETPLVWGCDAKNPDSWSPLHQKLIRPYIYAIEPTVANPFPYVKFLRDQGFEVLLAPAAKCSGDAAYVPMRRHLANCCEAVRTAAKANALGVVVTSWSVRRTPWPLTENTLIAAAMCMQNPGVTGKEMDFAFVEDNFGVSDTALARIPDILGEAAAQANSVCNLTRMGLTYPEEDIGFVDDYAVRLKRQSGGWKGNAQISPAYETLVRAAKEAQSLLDRAKPKTDEQKNRVAFWQWSIDTALLLGEYAPWLTEETIPREKAKELLSKFESLEKQGTALLSEIYTAYSMDTDTRSRIGIHTDYLRQFI